MHAALTLDEVVELIVSYLPSSAVLAVSRVCKHWYSVAGPVYWQDKVVTVDRLLTLLPPGVVTQHKPISFRAGTGPPAFARIVQAAPRIRNLLLRYWPPIDHRVFDTLTEHTYQAFLEPGLRKIDWRVSAQSHIRMFVAVLAPSVRGITVSFPNMESTFDLVKMFDAIRVRAPNTRSLNISILYPSPLFMEAFVQCIRSLDLRQAILQFNIASAALRVLATLPHLDWLDCECHSDLGAWQPASGDLFPALRRLRLNGYTPAFMSILESISRPYLLESLNVNIGDGLESAVGATLALLDGAAPHLRTLVLRCHTSALKSRPPVDKALVGSVHPGLLHCPKLEYVHIVYPYALQWDDADLTRLANALPDLRTLKLNAYPALPPQEPHATLACLDAFATACPHLFELELFLCVTPPPPAPAHAPHRPLRFLDLGKSPLAPGAHPQRVGAHLARAFPGLDELRSAEIDVSDLGLLWEGPEAGRARSGDWDVVRATYTAERGMSARAGPPDACLADARAGAGTPSMLHGPMFAAGAVGVHADVRAAWPFA